MKNVCRNTPGIKIIFIANYGEENASMSLVLEKVLENVLEMYWDLGFYSL